MKFATSRRMAAGATVLAVAGAAAGGAIAQADGGAGPVAQAAANGPETRKYAMTDEQHLSTDQLADLAGGDPVAKGRDVEIDRLPAIAR